MIEFYYHPLSPLSRRVWIALLEKEIDFKPIIINLSEGEQFRSDFLKISPFHHVPVIIDDGLRIIESLAILDYLESKYPNHSLLPQNAAQLAIVRMAEMVANNELSSLILPLIAEDKNSPKQLQTKRKIKRIIKFLAELLGDNNYFGGDRLSLGDIVAGNAIVLISKLGFDVSQVPKIEQWRDRLMGREIWQLTQPNEKEINVFRQTIQKLLILRR